MPIKIKLDIVKRRVQNEGIEIQLRGLQVKDTPKNIDALKERIKELKGHEISEADTSRLLIEPMLLLLGYDIYDWNVVREQVPISEASAKGNVGRADYGLRLKDRYFIMMEAKRLGSASINDVIELKKMIDYCTHEDRPRFGIITDGQNWKVYDNQIGGPISSRLLLDMDVLCSTEMLKLIRCDFAAELIKFADIIKDIRLNNSDAVAPLLTDLVIQKFLNLKQEEYSIISSAPLHGHIGGISQELNNSVESPNAHFCDQSVMLPLGTFLTKNITGLKPLSLHINSSLLDISADNKTDIHCTTWSSLYVKILEILMQYDQDMCLKLCFPRGGAFFLTEDPSIAINYHAVNSKTKGVFFTVGGAANVLIKRAIWVVESLGLELDVFSVRLSRET